MHSCDILRMGKKMAKDEFDGMGATSKRDTWRPPKLLKKHKCEDKVRKCFYNRHAPAPVPLDVQEEVVGSPVQGVPCVRRVCARLFAISGRFDLLRYRV